METIYIPSKKLLIVKENGKITKAYGGITAMELWKNRTITLNTN